MKEKAKGKMPQVAMFNSMLVCIVLPLGLPFFMHNCDGTCYRQANAFAFKAPTRLFDAPLHCQENRSLSTELKRRLLTQRVSDLPVKSTSKLCSINIYGKGAEIWPPKNIDRPIQLQDSFPNDGHIPQTMQEAFDPFMEVDETYSVSESMSPESNTGSRASPQSSTTLSISRKRKRERVWNILKLAARFEQRGAAKEASLSTDYIPESAPLSVEERRRINKSPVVLAVALIALRVVNGWDIFFTLSISTYLAVLLQYSRSTNPHSMNPGKRKLLPALPPQGHVPSIMANPLGHTLTESSIYRTWLISGAVLGLVLPLLSTTYYLARQSRAAALLCSSPLFLICCQAWTESIFRQMAAPLPLRILIPLTYNTRRLRPLFEWAFVPSQVPAGIEIGYFGRALAMLNMLYWSLNLFGFLIPVATLRYIRAHCFSVEASEVTLREGHEDGAGLLPQI